MNVSELKNLAKRLGGILVLNGNEPEFVILAYENYRRLETGSAGEHGESAPSQTEENAIERLNREILALKEEIRQKEEAELLTDKELTDLATGSSR